MSFLGFDLLSLVSLSATLSTVGFFLCGIPICIQISKSGSTINVSAVPFIVCSFTWFGFHPNCLYNELSFIFSAMLWLRYGLLKGDTVIVFVNCIAVMLEVSYLIFYWLYEKQKKTLNRRIWVGALLTAALLSFVEVSRRVQSESSALLQLGIICVVGNIVNFGAPLASLKEVLASKSTASLPFPLCVANFLVGLQWFLYGILVNDLFIVFPNFVGVLLAVGQLSLFVIYPSHSEMKLSSISSPEVSCLRQVLEVWLWLMSTVVWWRSVSVYVRRFSEDTCQTFVDVVMEMYIVF